jgi:hypothetical protein
MTGKSLATVVWSIVLGVVLGGLAFAAIFVFKGA